MATANLPAECPNCGASRVSSPEKFDAGQTLCTQCEDRMHDHDMTMQRDEHLASSRYHRASKMLSAEWDWGHSHDCPDCAESFYCDKQGCRPGPRACPNCEDLQAAGAVEDLRPQSLDSSDLPLLDL